MPWLASCSEISPIPPSALLLDPPRLAGYTIGFVAVSAHTRVLPGSGSGSAGCPLWLQCPGTAGGCAGAESPYDG